MNIIWAVILLAGGLVVLWKSAELLVDGAVGLAVRLGISTLIIGLTVVAMGTSAPEMAAGIAAAVKGAGDVAIGNVYGSNIANLALVGGLCALIRPVRIKRRMQRREIPVMLLVALLLWPVLNNLYLSRPEGFVLLIVFGGLILLTVYSARKEAAEKKLEPNSAPKKDALNGQRKISNMKKCILLVVVGLAGLTLGADMTVRGAVCLGERIGMTKAVIGLTIIAVGTSLPELVTCVVASVKGQHDISIGNLVDSIIFNTLLVTGTAGLIRPFEIVQSLAGFDYWVMIIVTAGFVLMALLGRRIGRAGGIILIGGYIAYMVYLLAFSV